MGCCLEKNCFVNHVLGVLLKPAGSQGSRSTRTTWSQGLQGPQRSQGPLASQGPLVTQLSYHSVLTAAGTQGAQGTQT